jgi:hypothetical protein
VIGVEQTNVKIPPTTAVAMKKGRERRFQEVNP